MEEKNVTETQSVVEGYDLNLSDFALFLSVMKQKTAYESVLSIIMDEDDLVLEEVEVEQVVLNKSGKRAIRLDAWAVDIKERQFNTEMQNDTKNDDVRKRSRFYQGILDTPILKSGKKTKYKHLPSTVIIFITQEDIFGRDLAKYTFTEQCEEIMGLHLEDGTQKIFLNMSSKNGRPELISLLQYMKKTSLENPEVLVKDKRIEKLDDIVSEVKQSEEWEAVRMNILEIGINQGIEQGIEQGETLKLIQQICKKLCKGKDISCIAEEVEESFEMVSSICDIAEKFGPDYDENMIYEEYSKTRNKI